MSVLLLMLSVVMALIEDDALIYLLFWDVIVWWVQASMIAVS